MFLASVPALLSIDEYVRRSYQRDVDLVEGQIEGRNLGEFEHARDPNDPELLLEGEGMAGEDGCRVARPCDLEPGTDLRPCDFAGGGATEKVTEMPPPIRIEILPPEDRLARAQAVLTDYRAMGVANIWLIDPLRRSAHTFDQEVQQHARW